MLITSNLKFTENMAIIGLEVIINKADHMAMNKAVFATTEKTLAKVLESAVEKELEKAMDVAREVEAARK